MTNSLIYYTMSFRLLTQDSNTIILFRIFLIYKNDFKISNKIFYKKNKFKGKLGIFEINKNVITHQLNFYSVENNQFKKIF